MARGRGLGLSCIKTTCTAGAVSRCEVMFKKSGQGSASHHRGCSDLIKFAFLITVQTAESHGEGCQQRLLGDQVVGEIGTQARGDHS